MERGLTDELARDAELRLVARVDAPLAAPPHGFPHVADPASGRWRTKPGGAWAEGFWVGLLWLAHAATGASEYRRAGLEWAERLHGCYNLPTGDAPDAELVWGDYFLLEALLRRRGGLPR